MNNRERKARFKRVVKALEMLRQVQLGHQADADFKRNEASQSASELDDIDLRTSPAWAKFAQNWLNYRAKLDEKVNEQTVLAQAAKIEARRLEKAARRYSELIVELDAAEEKSQAIQDILDFVANSGVSGKSALSKIASVDSKKDKY